MEVVPTFGAKRDESKVSTTDLNTMNYLVKFRLISGILGYPEIGRLIVGELQYD